MTRANRTWRVAIAVLVIFFSGLVVPRAFPSVERSGIYFVYFLAAILAAALLSFIAVASAAVAVVGRMTGRTRAFDLALRSLGISDRKSTRLNSSHIQKSRMPSSA